jgi:CubicO group peptidase (beta-lactamase class C family)
MTTVQRETSEFPFRGSCDPRFGPVREAFEANLRNGWDVGASVAITLDGETVVDLWGGAADAAKTKPWEADTLVSVFSTTKTMTALSALYLADQGDLDLDAPVARYWPEFSVAGKAQVLVRHLLGHTAGLPTWDEQIGFDDLFDWEKVTGLLARQAPWWTPGEAGGYHGLTQGYLVGEVIRRITGQTPGPFFAREIAEPLGGGFYIGLPESEDHRVSLGILPATPEEPRGGPDSFGMKVHTNPGLPREKTWLPSWRRGESPAANGHGNARSIARIQSLLACGGEVNGRRMMSREGCEAVLRQQSNGNDLVVLAPIRWGLGYALNTMGLALPTHGRVCVWGGSGGSLIVVDFQARMTFAFAMNQLEGSPFGDRRGQALVAAVYRSLAEARS